MKAQRPSKNDTGSNTSKAWLPGRKNLAINSLRSPRDPLLREEVTGQKSDRHEKCRTVTTHEVVNGRSVVQNLEFADYDSLPGFVPGLCLTDHATAKPYRMALQ